MNHRLAVVLMAVLVWLAFPQRSPAPLIYRPDEGWVYEKPGADTSWQRGRAKDQLQVAQEAFDRKDYSLASKAAKRVVSRWPFSDFAPQAQYLSGRCYEAEGKDVIAFKHYQSLLEKYPKMTNTQEVLQRQYVIATKFLNGQWRKLYGYIPIPPSMDKTVEMYEKIVKNAPYSDLAPQAQMNIGAAREKQKDYAAAVKSYELVADKYADRQRSRPTPSTRPAWPPSKNARRLNMTRTRPVGPSTASPTSPPCIPMTNGWRTCRSGSTNSRTSRPGAVSRWPGFTKRSTNGTRP